MIVIPMAGMSSRFFKAGYKLPKYMLKANGKSLFTYSIESFAEYFESQHFLFIIRDIHGTYDFVKREITLLGIKHYSIINLNEKTRGQAETVTLGLLSWKEDIEHFSDTSITIFNIDTFRPGFKFPSEQFIGDGFLEVFKGSGDNWSFVKSLNSSSSRVIETTEKIPISNLCCTGLYHFKSMVAYLESYEKYSSRPISEWDKGELYVAPLYNLLIKSGAEIHYSLIERNQVIFCGVPEEYNEFLKR